MYLLGATLYHLLTGQPPRHGSSCEQVMELARSVPPPPPRKLKGDIARALEAICLKAMAQRPQDRYAGTLDLAWDVQRYLAGAPVSVYREPVLARAWRWCKRHRHALARSAAGVLALVLLLLGAKVLQDAQNRADALQREAAELELRQQIRKDLEQFDRLAADRQFYAAGTTPAGERLLHYHSRRGEEAGEEALAMADKLTEELRQLPSAENRDVFERELHDLLLLMVQGEAEAEQPPGPDAVEQMLRRLERAASLQGPSRSYFHLRALCFHLRGNEKQAAEEDRRASLAADRPGLLPRRGALPERRLVAGQPPGGCGNLETKPRVPGPGYRVLSESGEDRPERFLVALPVGPLLPEPRTGGRGPGGPGYLRGPAAGEAVGIQCPRPGPGADRADRALYGR